MAIIDMKFTEILKRNRELHTSVTGEPYEIAIISNIVIAQLKDVVECSLLQEGVNANVSVGNYDSVVQDSVKFSKSNAVIVFWEACNFIDALHDNIYLMKHEDILSLSRRVEAEIGLVLQNLIDTQLVLINRFSSVAFDATPLKEGPLRKLCATLNAYLQNMVGPNQIIIDLEMILCGLGLGVSTDLRQYQSSKSLYSFRFLKSYAEAVKPAFLAATGHIRKILVLDCDNTLWGGVIGEDGDLGIEMSETTIKGKTFHEVQKIICGLEKEGVLIALCSKNNQSDVDHVLSEHKDMFLKDDSLVAKKINWNNKADNLRELSKELNIGLDSFVFVDDSCFELGLIRKEIHQVKCVEVPQNLSEYPSLIRKLRNDFFKLSNTTEDNCRTKMYKQDLVRKETVSLYKSIEEYLASLELKLTIFWNEDIPVSRTAQMTQKTNQFNLTTRRYTESDIQRMLSNSDHLLAVFSLSDRYGDYGVAGMIIVRLCSATPNSAEIDTFLMSCRVIGRNVEYRFFDVVVGKLFQNGVSKLRAEYIATHKNVQVGDLYERLGFSAVGESGTNKLYSMDLENYNQSGFTYIECN